MVVTYGLLETGGEHRVLLTSLDTGATSEADAPGLALTEFAVSADGRTIYAIDGGALVALGIYDGHVTVLRDAEAEADNLCLLPDGDTLLVTRQKTSLLDLVSLSTGQTTRTVELAF
jgi:hypothetical protein